MAYAADLCGSKLKAKLAATLNESAAAPISSSSFAAKQMAKMGWKEGTGLGKKRDGMVSHIKVKQREESAGLGVEKERTRQMGAEGMWWSTNVSDTLMRLQQQKSKKEAKKKQKKESKKSSKKEKKEKKKDKAESAPVVPKVYTDEELFKATGGARFGMRAQRRAEGKWQRTESSKDLKEWERAVKDKIEWNGLGKAKVLLSEGENASNKTNEGATITGRKKRKRTSDDNCFEEEKKEDGEPIKSTEMEESNDSGLECAEKSESESKDERKRRKKNKTEKKSSKKSKKKEKKRRKESSPASDAS